METVRRPPPNNIMSEYVTVVSVGATSASGTPSHQMEIPSKVPQLDPSGFVTVLKIGDVPPKAVNHSQTSQPNTEGQTSSQSSEEYLVEQVLVYRLPGERLGFGLKFEGGTKAAEFVKRLFIQSCAPDSPASRVRGSWGALTEGDEVLAIDSVKVTSMTRIDCVRCLKDSNVVINLQVRHKVASTSEDGKSEAPLVISAEKKRTPPPPPPVPPRKGPRKKDLHAPLPPKGFGDNEQGSAAPIPQSRAINGGVIHPPDAEVYMDLFSPEHLREQESYCHSESDDTGSSISTVVDRFGSFPTTTTSSFAGSMPSTPTAVQKRIQHINPFDVEHSPDEELLFERLVSLQAKENQVTLQPPANFQDAPLSYADEDLRNLEAAILPNSNIEKTRSRKRPPPPPPPRTKHQAQNDDKEEIDKEEPVEEIIEDKIIETNNNDYNREDENSKMLPRLVDFVPKSTKSDNDSETTTDASTMFIEQEQLRHTDSFFLRNTEDVDDLEDDGKWDVEEEEQETYAFGWCSGQPLATIGEADNEDESLQDIDTPSSTNGHTTLSANNQDDGEEVDDDEADAGQRSEEVDQLDAVDGAVVNGDVDILDRNDENEITEEIHQKTPEPAPRKLKSLAPEADEESVSEDKMDTRQPPDGHEFPDYHQESPLAKPPATPTTPQPAMLPRRLRDTQSVVGLNSLSRSREQPKTNVKNMIAMFSHNGDPVQPTPPPPLPTPTHVPTINGSMSSGKLEKTTMRSSSFDFSINPMTRGSMSDLTSDTLQASTPRESAKLHKRSQSLVDISSTNDRWTQILDQRRKGISKLKGLIIPEHPDLTQESTPIDLPEIKSLVDTPLEFLSPVTTSPILESRIHHTRNNSTPSLNISSSPLWSTDMSDVECAKYSPAFKRKTLQVYSTKLTKDSTSSSDEEYRLPSADAPKSLESITSPTRSDCSFDYASMGSMGSSTSPLTNTTTSKTTKSEDESDNDSAVSSSQSSYISRQSPPASPNHLYDSRMLKPQSVEAINRKNILASAKCRSGKDLNGSPRLIQRKFDEPEPITEKKIEEIPKVAIETIIVDRVINTTDIQNGVKETKPLSAKKDVIEIKDTRTLKPRETKLSTDVKPLVKTDLDRLTSRFLSSRNTKAASVTDLRKNFERSTSVPTPPVSVTNKSITIRGRHSISSITSTASTTSTTRPTPNKRNSVPATTTDSKVDTKEIVKTTVKSWEEEGVVPGDVKVIALRPEIPGGSIGITLAGGTDYETKDITIHKVRNGSVAHLDGRLYKGERVLAINGKSMNGITHAESMAILKEPVNEVIVVTSPPREAIPSTPEIRKSIVNSPTSPSITSTVTTKLEATKLENNMESSKPTITVKLIKDPLSTASGLGFSMEGGRGSPQGDVPLLIKKLFTGGLADKSGMLAVGDELVEIQGTDVTGMPRIDAWSLMKKLPPGEVTLKVRR